MSLDWSPEAREKRALEAAQRYRNTRQAIMELKAMSDEDYFASIKVAKEKRQDLFKIEEFCWFVNLESQRRNGLKKIREKC